MAEPKETETVKTELRVEAQPVERWDRLTLEQQKGVTKLLRMLDEAVQRSERKQGGRLPWLVSETKTQLAFVDGDRGVGKSTLMTTLVGALDDPKDFLTNDKLTKEVRELIPQLHNHVVPVQPLDMESLPKDTPLMAAILARVYQAAEAYGISQNSQSRLLHEDPRDQRELQKLMQYQQSVAKALDSNLCARKANLDSEQFAEAVMSEEACRLKLVSELQLVLEGLADLIRKQLQSNSPDDRNNRRRLLFLIPIDDIDLNPRRCMELLRLLRTFSPPRELFFLLMGQYELVEAISNLRMAADFGHMRKNAGDLSTVSMKSLRNEIAAVSLANVRKMIPPNSRIRLPSLSLLAAYLFTPLGIERDRATTLLSLLKKIQLRNEDGYPARFANLAELMLLAGNRALTDLGDVVIAGNYVWNQHCAPGAFQVQARRLVDLWMELSQLCDEFGDPDVPNREIARRVHHVLKQQWHRTVDADPLLSPEIRRRLQTEGPRSCSIMVGANDRFDRDLEIAAESEQTGDPLRHYVPRLRFAALEAGSGVPNLMVGTPVADESSSRGGTSVTSIEHIQTRCAHVFYHDIEELFDDNKKTAGGFRLLTAVKPVVLSWNGSEGRVGDFAWPLPPLTTYVEMSQFLARWCEYWEGISNDVSNEKWQVSSQTVAQLVQAWAVIGLTSVEESIDGTCAEACKESREEIDSWERFTVRVLSLRQRTRQQNHLRGLAQVELWFRRIIQLVHPEFCSPAVSKTIIEQIEKVDELRGKGDRLEDLAVQSIGALRNDRIRQLEPLVRNGAPELWRDCNQNTTSRWLFVKLDEQSSEGEPEVLSKLQQLDVKIDRMQREMRSDFRRAELVSLWRQGELATIDDPATAARLFRQACELAQRIVEAKPRSTRALRDLSYSLDQCGENEERRAHWNEAAAAFERALAIDRKLAEANKDSRRAQHDLAVSLARTGGFHLRRENLEAAAAAYEESLGIARKLVDEKVDESLRDLAIALIQMCDIEQRRGNLEAAQQLCEQSLQIAQSRAAADADNEETQRELTWPLIRMGDIRWRLGDVDSAERQFQDALEKTRRIANSSTNMEVQRGLVVLLIRLCDVQMKRKQIEAAEASVREAIDRCTILVASDPKGIRSNRDLSVAIKQLGEVYQYRKQTSKARLEFEKALKIAEHLAILHPNDRAVQRDIAKYLAKLASTRRNSRALRERAWSILLDQEEWTIRYDLDLSQVYESLKAEFQKPRPKK